MKKTIMLLGIHGVGKTCLLSNLHIDNYSASSLMREYKRKEVDDQKKVRNVEENQNVLLNALRARNLIGKKFILDGHCCLLNADNGVQKIDKSVFEQLELGGIIVLYEDEKVIWERLKRRDGLELDIYLLEEFQQAEIMYAKQLAEEIGIPYLMTKNEEEKISAFINSVWR